MCKNISIPSAVLSAKPNPATIVVNSGSGFNSFKNDFIHVCIIHGIEIADPT